MNLYRVCVAYLTHLEKRTLGGTALPTPNLGARLGAFQLQNATALLRIGDCISIAQEAGRTSLLAWVYSGYLTPNGVHTPDRPSSSESKYGSRYPGRHPDV